MNTALAIDPTDSLGERQVVAQAMGWWLEETLTTQFRDGSANDGGFEMGLTQWCDGRQAAYILARLVAIRTFSTRIEYNEARLDEAIHRAMSFILRRQHPDGRLDLVGLYTANEVGFTLPGLAAAYRAAEKLPGDRYEEFRRGLKTFLLKGADAVVRGEAYTANHRWAAAAAPLASVHALWPAQCYLDKIESYLADGIDCDADGCWYEERSPNYNTVANHGLIIMADCLGRPEFLAPVVRSLDFVLHCLQPNGEADATFSFRQDRGIANALPSTYLVARRVAQLTGDGRITTLAQQVWQGAEQFELMPLLFEMEAHPEPLPAPLPLPERYERFFPSIGLIRYREGETALSISADKGGHFFDTVRDGWGGPKRSDDWFHLQHGDVVIQSIHLGGANMCNVQPTDIAPRLPGGCSFDCFLPGWTGILHFRPGSPQVDMRWDWENHIEVSWGNDAVDLQLHSDSPESLAATLTFWLRPGVTVTEGETRQQIEAGQTTMLRGGLPLTIASATHSIEIQGLPPAAHRWNTQRTQAIPTTIPRTCGAIGLGMVFPIDLRLQMKLS